MSNITSDIKGKMNHNLHMKKNHPIEIIKNKIYDFFGEGYEKFENLDKVVSVSDNFDKLLIPESHPSRSKSDTYYVSEDKVLRTHTSAHQNELLVKGCNKFLVVGDVYRKDTVDRTHYPIFHQMEGVAIVEEGMNARQELEKTLVGLVNYLFPGCEYRIKDDYFPFTTESLEIEVLYNGTWLEILGGGVIHQQILNNCGVKGTGWAFGLGLERLAMILFNIPDIRYFWTDDERFMKQFESGEIIEFKEYSKYPPCKKDITFWINEKYSYNDFCEIVRECGGDLVEDVNLIDKFEHAKSKKVSHCYRITYRSNDRSLTDEEINKIQDEVRSKAETNLKLELR